MLPRSKTRDSFQELFGPRLLPLQADAPEAEGDYSCGQIAQKRDAEEEPHIARDDDLSRSAKNSGDDSPLNE